jgi:hypothetical protein
MYLIKISFVYLKNRPNLIFTLIKLEIYSARIYEKSKIKGSFIDI